MSDVVPLPDEPGFYLWYILDLNYLNVGMVQIMADRPEQLVHLRANPNPDSFYIYELGEDIFKHTYTMYHQAYGHVPPHGPDGLPHVDGYLPFDMRTLFMIKAPPIKLEGKRIPLKEDTKPAIRETAEGFKILREGDEWQELEYRGTHFKYIGVGASGYYRSGEYLGYTGSQVKEKLDAQVHGALSKDAWLASLAAVSQGFVRHWVKCRKCGRIYQYINQPNSLSTAIRTLPCGHGSGEKDLPIDEVSEDDAYAFYLEKKQKAKVTKL